jgi:hypothetical protein
MYSIRFSDWGLVLEFDGPVSQKMVQDWLNDVQHLTDGFTEPFQIMLDLRNAEPAESGVEPTLHSGLRALKRAGMDRAAIIISEARRGAWSELLAEAEISGQRHIVARNGSGWEEQARRWVHRGTTACDAGDSSTGRDTGHGEA